MSNFIVRDDRPLTVDEVGVVADTLVGLKMRSPQYEAIVDHLIDDWHTWMKYQPHEHYLSILGAYCVVCRVGIPREDWDATRAPR